MSLQNVEVAQKTIELLNQGLITEGEQNQLIDTKEMILKACKQIAPIWPLTNFIAINPLQGFENRSFKDGVKMARKYFHGNGLASLSYFHAQYRSNRITSQDLLESVKNNMPSSTAIEGLANILAHEAMNESNGQLENEVTLEGVFLVLSEWSDQLFDTKLSALMQTELSKWCAAYFDSGEAAWTMPGRESGFFSAWKQLQRYDKSYERAGVKGLRQLVEELPENATDAIELLLQKLGVPNEFALDYLMRHLATAPGWSGLFVHLGSENNFYDQTDAFSPLQDYLAVRLAYDLAGASYITKVKFQSSVPWASLVQAARKRWAKSDEIVQCENNETAEYIWLQAFEKNFRDRLVKKLKASAVSLAQRKRTIEERPKAQAIFCIDVRSEPLRRNLENQGNYETYGFAGFFAIPLAYKSFGAKGELSQCPVLIRPKYLISETPRLDDAGSGKIFLKRLQGQRFFKSAVHEVKNTSVSPFAMVETFGIIGFFSMYSQSFFPAVRKKLGGLLSKISSKKVKFSPLLESFNVKDNPLYTEGIPFQDRLTIAENSLRTIGLVQNFARLILICGHGSTTVNNAYASALDCGACGGHRGASNARVAAEIFNDPLIRVQLEKVGINIPKDTFFLAAEHDSAIDSISILNEKDVPVSHFEELKSLKNTFSIVRNELNLERTQRFDIPSKSTNEASEDVNRRSQDWSEARPEWALAGNAAFIVGKRSLTKGIDLKSRSFLHSYDWSTDSEGKALEVIMTAPMVVGEWINMQYYFSSVDNEVFGSGNKVIHNIVGRIGVMQGNVSDLKIGLPLQSVSNGKDLVHEPMRLLVIIEAPMERISGIVKKHESVRRLVVNEWISLVCLGPADQNFYRLNTQTEWELLS